MFKHININVNMYMKRAYGMYTLSGWHCCTLG